MRNAEYGWFAASASRVFVWRRTFFPLDFHEFLKRSGGGVRYHPTIEAVCVPIDEIKTLIAKGLLPRVSIRIPFAAHE